MAGADMLQRWVDMCTYPESPILFFKNKMIKNMNKKQVNTVTNSALNTMAFAY